MDFPKEVILLSTTKGVVSRIEHQDYAHSNFEFLTIQMDAALNSGSSGGPAFVDDKICGIAMQTLEDAENASYLVPVEILRHFLVDVEDGRYDGFPFDGIYTQETENEGMRKMYGISEDKTGVLVSIVIPGSPADGKIMPGDVLLSIDGHDIANDGTVEFRPRERTTSDYYIQRHQIGETAVYRILRNKQIVSVPIVLGKRYGSDDLELVRGRRYDIRPTYYIYGGLVFIPLTLDYMRAWGDDWRDDAPTNQKYYYYYDWPSMAGEEAVILSKVLLSEVNKGYSDFSERRIFKVNSKRIRNLKHLIDIVEGESGNPFVVFETRFGEKIVLDRRMAEADQPKILEIYDIPADRSENLR